MHCAPMTSSAATAVSSQQAGGRRRPLQAGNLLPVPDRGEIDGPADRLRLRSLGLFAEWNTPHVLVHGGEIAVGTTEIYPDQLKISPA